MTLSYGITSVHLIGIFAEKIPKESIQEDLTYSRRREATIGWLTRREVSSTHSRPLLHRKAHRGFLKRKNHIIVASLGASRVLNRCPAARYCTACIYCNKNQSEFSCSCRVSGQINVTALGRFLVEKLPTVKSLRRVTFFLSGWMCRYGSGRFVEKLSIGAFAEFPGGLMMLLTSADLERRRKGGSREEFGAGFALNARKMYPAKIRFTARTASKQLITA